MAASSAGLGPPVLPKGGGSEIWQRVDRRKGKNKIEEPGKSVRSEVPFRSFVDQRGFGRARAPISGSRSFPASKVGFGPDASAMGIRGLDRRPARAASVIKINPLANKLSWLDVCTDRRKFAESIEMSFVQPVQGNQGEIMGVLSEDLLAETADRWGCTLVGYVLGDKPFYSQIKAWSLRTWRKEGFSVFGRDNGFFFFRFRCKKDRDEILYGGPWMFDGRLVVLQCWTPNFRFDRDMLSSAPIWVRFPNLPLHLWSLRILNVIASVLGNPICLDKATASMERLAFARCLVDISAAGALPSSVLVQLANGELIKVAVQFEGEPPRCVKCLCFGHLSSQCSALELGSSAVNHVDAVNDVGVSEKVSGVNTGPVATSLAAGVMQGANVLETPSVAKSNSQGEVADELCNSNTNSDEICNMNVNVRPRIEEVSLAATRLMGDALGEQCKEKGDYVTVDSLVVSSRHVNAHVELGDELLKGESVSPNCDVHEELCTNGSDLEEFAKGRCELDDDVRGLGIADKPAPSVVPGSVSMIGGEACGDVCNELLAASSSADGCNLNPTLAVPSRVVMDHNGGLCKGMIDREQTVIGSSSGLASSVADVGLAGSVLSSSVDSQLVGVLGSDGVGGLVDGSGVPLVTGVVGSMSRSSNSPAFRLDEIPLGSLPSTDLPTSQLVILGSPPLDALCPLPGMQKVDCVNLVADVEGTELMGDDSVANGFQIGKQFLLGHEEDRAVSFEFTKINDAWLLEQELARQSAVKSKNSSSSNIGVRKSSRFVGGAGPTPPARFRK